MYNPASGYCIAPDPRSPPRPAMGLLALNLKREMIPRLFAHRPFRSSCRNETGLPVACTARLGYVDGNQSAEVEG